MSHLVLELKTPKVHHEEEADKKDPKKKGAADPKKDPKDTKPDPKKAKPGAGKADEEESSKPAPQVKVKIGLDMIEEKSLEVFLKSVKSIQSRTPKLLMVLVTLEDAELLGTDPEEVSIRFLLEKLNSYLETKVIWEKNWIIPDWADRLENEVYPEEGVILFENLALWPLELGYEVLEDPTAKHAAISPNIASSTVASGADLVSKPAAATKPGAAVSTSAVPLAASTVVAPTAPATRRFRCLYAHISEGARTLSQYANVHPEVTLDIHLRRPYELRKARQAVECVHQARSLRVREDADRPALVCARVLQVSARKVHFASRRRVDECETHVLAGVWPPLPECHLGRRGRVRRQLVGHHLPAISGQQQQPQGPILPRVYLLSAGED